jgi:hypothetical protein
VSAVMDAVDWATAAEGLIEDIEALETTAAPLRAVYGSFGTFDYERKALLCAVADSLRLGYQRENVKYTEAQIDQKAHADPQYIGRITLATQERTRLALLDAELTAKQRRYELARARLYLTGRLAGLQ